MIKVNCLDLIWLRSPQWNRTQRTCPKRERGNASHEETRRGPRGSTYSHHSCGSNAPDNARTMGQVEHRGSVDSTHRAVGLHNRESSARLTGKLRRMFRHQPGNGAYLRDIDSVAH